MSYDFRLGKLMRRRDATRVDIDNPWQVPATLYANEDVHIEEEGIAQFLSFLDVEGTARRIAEAEQRGELRQPFWGPEGAGRLERVILTPDFHKGSGIPVGTVASTSGFILPQAVGNDINCGMRLVALEGVTRSELEGRWPAIEARLRALFFEGQRDIPMSPDERRALLQHGLVGLHEALSRPGGNLGKGLWSLYDPASQKRDLDYQQARGSHALGDLPAVLDDFIRSSGDPSGRDSQIGSVGGGNHFVELQVIDEVLHGSLAHAWGLHKGALTLMVHSGSVGLGHLIGSHFRDVARKLFPPELKHPENGYYLLPTRGPHAAKAQAYLAAMRAAANFAFGNRLCLGLMCVRALNEVLGRRIRTRLVYDAPHNLIWDRPDGTWLHRKGACPAHGFDPQEAGGPFVYSGRPVIIPGSMGSWSYVLEGLENTDALSSACHGAGRSMSRGKAGHVGEEEYTATYEKLRVVTPIDPQAPSIRGRPDILAKYHSQLKEEAPFAYKPILPIIETVAGAGIANPVARLWPLLTVKG